MALLVLGIFIGSIIGAAIMAVLACGGEADRIPLEEHLAAVEAAKTDAFRQGKLMQALTQSEKDSARAKKAAQTRRTRQTAPDRRGAP